MLMRYSPGGGGALQNRPDLLLEKCKYIGGVGVDKFSTGVDLVDTSVEEGLVESGVDSDGIVCEEGVNIEYRGDGGVAEFADAVYGAESSGHANLENVVAEGPGGALVEKVGENFLV